MTQSGELTHQALVGPDEIDPQQGWISIDAPLARALLKKAVDDEVRVATPHGEKVYYVIEVRYEETAR